MVAGRQNDELLRIADRQWTKQKRVDDAVDRGIEPDAER
jgi:hypothetical protein